MNRNKPAEPLLLNVQKYEPSSDHRVARLKSARTANAERLRRFACAVGLTLCGAACSSAASDAGGGSTLGGAGSAGASGGGAQSGGSTASGGGPAGGGSSGGGLASTGGSGGSAGVGGSSSLGGASATGGVSGSAGGAAGGAAGASGGSAGATCALPTTFKWTSGGPIATPKNGWVAIKDFTQVLYNNKHVVYMSTHDSANYGSAMMTFDDWPNADAAPQTKTASGVAPTLFYFTPKKLWVLAYQWGGSKFSYKTSSDPTLATGWSGEKSLYNTALPTGGTGPIDQTEICNATKCFLFYAGDNGHIYKSSMAIGSFPSEFPAAADSGIQGTSQNLFEAVQVYAVKGSSKYLMIVEAQGSARYFRAFTATDLDGAWTLLTDNFAIKSNVNFSTSWTNDISHGDLVRNNPDETFTVDPCNLQMLFQGRDPNSAASYDLLPYKLGLLTLVH